ncbi:uncharacterized protein si:cabz01068815.1 [Chanos chanos]|uniref:Uncharacterized protein LOC115829150 n=1 Tax=Chanos chanos TaxID=29144 RepID=A0A6J2WXR9_CHACN|nr:uncharacterized protein LOC115829150 [Chanos chanos]XP_030649074.1 uncharacterized protein LOC115829150 [Chanos chanos]
MMFQVWIALCLIWQGANSFMIHNTIESLCLEDSGNSDGVQLKRCSLDSEFQQWSWINEWFLMNAGTQKCLSAFHTDPVKTVPCDGLDSLQWQCRNHRLISQNRSLELSAERGQLTMSPRGKTTRWKSLDEGDICQDKLRSKRSSDEPNEFEFSESEDAGGVPGMTEEQKAFLRWYYRTEDPTSWKFAMLALSFAALLLGGVLFVTGMMASRSRKKIAKYKAAAAKAATPEAEELRVIAEVISEPKEGKDSYQSPLQDGNLVNQPAADMSETDGIKAGDIVVTWKDGNVSNLFSEVSAEAPEEEH